MADSLLLRDSSRQYIDDFRPLPPPASGLIARAGQDLHRRDTAADQPLAAEGHAFADGRIK
ncbi:MAG: hypothetical protein ACREMA_01990 [Longimicrobiales bacterium]